MTMTQEPTHRETMQAAEIRELRRELDAASREIDALTAQLEGDVPRATEWLQTKVWRQRAALDRLNKRVVAQRWYLRLCTSLGRPPTREEYQLARQDAERWELAALEAEEPIR